MTDEEMQAVMICIADRPALAQMRALQAILRVDPTPILLPSVQRWCSDFGPHPDIKLWVMT